MEITSEHDTSKSQSAKQETAPWVCSDCGASRLKPVSRVPQGWKRRDDNKLFCGDCWGKQYILRAVACPVASPVDCTWGELRAAIKRMWDETSRAANWMMTELYARDVRPNGEAKMPPMASVYLYPAAREKFQSLPAASLAALERVVQRTYRAKRYEVIWTNAASLPTYRYPVPFPTPNQAWSVAIVDERPVVSVRIGDRRVAMKLKGGPRFHRQLTSIRNIESGAAVKGQLEIYQQGANLMCKMVAWLPREQQTVEEKVGTLAVRTGIEWILAAFNEKDERVWFYNGDHLRRWAMEHSSRLQRWSQDQKAEEQPVPSFVLRRKEAVDRYHRKMATACHQISSMLVNYAERRKLLMIRYDDSEKAFLKQFQWFRFAELIAEKCNAKGISFEKVSGGITMDLTVAADE